MLLGAVLAFGVMWPAIGRQAGIWYPAGLSERDFSGLYGYKVSTLISILSVLSTARFQHSDRCHEYCLPRQHVAVHRI